MSKQASTTKPNLFHGPYRRAIAAGHYAHAAHLYGRRQRGILIASITMYTTVFLWAAWMFTMLVP